ncbi:MAG TPA: LysM peptidoglycan-binding domain-containing protein [Aggregatilineaceae bacterium]|nr:LysM peptidoglycan-binding domain-containing protein [Aggregatilineaceae bacterium]
MQIQNSHRNSPSPLLLGGVIVLIVGLVLAGLVVLASAGDDSRPARNREEVAELPTLDNPPTATDQQIIIVITATPLPPTWTPWPSPTTAELAIILPTATATIEPTEFAMILPTTAATIMPTEVTILLPTTAATIEPTEFAMIEPTAVAQSGDCSAYTVQAGDTLASIAVKYGITVGELWDLNDLAGTNNLQVGQVLNVPCADTKVASGGCPTHTVQAGETLASIATMYGVTVVDLWNSNDLAGENVLEVGQMLLIPCAEAASSIEIVQVFLPGITASEFVEIRNNGATADLTGWRLVDADGNTFIFPSLRLFAGASIAIFSRSGENTPVSLYWGQNAAIWSAGETVTLMNPEGQVQAIYRIP